jgi:SAM-dependent methyltransferase
VGTERKDVWASGDAYEPYVGRWSRLIARQFIPWVGVPPEKVWLDVGCGTGVLSEVILDSVSPRSVVGVDPSDGFVSFARHKVTDPRATFEVGDAQQLPAADSSFDATVAGLVINFIPDQAKAVREMKRATRPGGTVAAYVARPGGNATGFTQVEYGMAAKWLELLKEIAPSVTRAAILRDPAVPEGIGQFTVIQSAAPALKVAVSPIDIRNAGEIERALTEFARLDNGGLILTSSALANVRRDLIISLAAKFRLPAVYSFRFFASAGGLAAYGSDSIDPHRRAAGYIDRILKGENPADMPVQAPTKYELAINLKTAKALGLAVPPSVLARADEVIE